MEERFMSKFKRVIITTVTPGRIYNSKGKAKEQVNKVAEKTLDAIAKELGAERIYLKTAPLYKGNDELDSYFDNRRVVDDDLELNQNCIIRGTLSFKPHVKVSEWLAVKNLQPSASVIIPGNKQKIKQLPRVGYIPRFVIQPGSITYPNYKDQDTGKFGLQDHTFGAIIIEYNRKEFFCYNIQLLHDYSAVHLGIHYLPNGKKRKLSPSEIMEIDGDKHYIELCKKTDTAIHEIRSIVKPHGLVIHDGLDGKSISHHDKDKFITQAQKASKGEHLLEREAEITYEGYKREEATVDKVISVACNHADFVSRYNESGDYIADKANWQVGGASAHVQFHDVHPTKFLICHYRKWKIFFEEYCDAIKNNRKQKHYIDTQSALPKTTWLDREDRFIFGGYDLSPHGDVGANGSRGIPKNSYKYYGLCVVGHDHEAWIDGKVMGVGTCSRLDLDYAKGKPSSWNNACGFIYAPKGYALGVPQLFVIRGGRWRLDKPNKRKK